MNMNGRAYISFFTCCLLTYLLFRIAFMNSQWNGNHTIGYDVGGYYCYLPAYFIYDDLAELQFMENIVKKHPSTNGNWSIAENGNKIQKYP
ncbi:MAG: hypothetical protein AB8B69_18435, partial [Chitinophagales bacterium]